MPDSGPPFRTTFEFTIEDLVDYLRLAQQTLNGIGMSGGVIGALYGIFLAWTGELLLGVVLAAMGVFLFLASATRFLDRVRAGSLGKRILGTRADFVIGDEGIDSTTIAGTAHIAWSAADRLRESHQVIVLRHGRTTVAWLPKRAMGDEAQREEQLAFIRAHVGRAGGR